MSQQLRERVRRFLLDELATGARHRSHGWLKWLFPNPEGTYAFEYADCDPERGHCTGEVLAAWLIDREGVRTVEASPQSVPDARRGMWYRFRRFHFHIAPSGDWVVKGAVDGPKAGCGGRFRVKPRGAGFELVSEGRHWRA